MTSKLAKALAMKQHGIVYPSSMVHISTFPLKLAQKSIETMEKTHSDKWDSCVADVQKSGKDVDPYAVCTASLGNDSFEADSGSSFPQALRSNQDGCECQP